MEPELEGGNIIEHMRKYTKMGHDHHRYFYMYSKVFKAIRDNICSKKCCLIEHPKDYDLKYWRGHGPVSFRDAHTYATQYTQDENHRTVTYEVDYYNLDFVVSYTHKEDYDDEYGPNAKEFKFSLKVPIELELKFTQKAFDEWAKKVGEENRKENRIKAFKGLEELTRYLYGDTVYEDWLDSMKELHKDDEVFQEWAAKVEKVKTNRRGP